MNSPAVTWMQRALQLAERGRGWVEPNPLVGAVLVKNGQVVGEGWHQKFGQAHAEINALAQAGEQARGADLFVTLEPCCHHGKTPPCTDALIRAGVARVVAAMRDPFPQVAGKGAALLAAASIPCEFGLEEQQARRLNSPYLQLLAKNRPYVHAKWAMTLDGKIATRTGDSRWISNEVSRRRVHELRGRMDGILVGIGTALADNPLLTARPPGPRLACRVVLDGRGRLPLSSQLIATAGQIPVLVAAGPRATDQPLEALRSAGCEVLVLPEDETGHPDVGALLAELGRRRWTNLLVEGGSAILGSFLDAGAIDEVHVFIAPLLAGGSQAKIPCGGQGVEKIAQALRPHEVQVEDLQGDIYWHGRIAQHG